ncbi:MAG TPA: type II toxin-antitoxin system VapC family toxin [Verrucomicrobiae bacterium]
MAGEQPMILDTCALLWLVSGEKKITRATLRQITEAPALYLCAISGFEIGLKVARGKLELPFAPAVWLEKVIFQHGITVLPLDLSTCIRAAELPPIHNDPCDRFIIAAAKINDLPVITADEIFEKYGLSVLL